MGIIEELQKANDTLKMQIKALSSDTQLPQNPVVEVVFVFYVVQRKRTRQDYGPYLLWNFGLYAHRMQSTCIYRWDADLSIFLEVFAFVAYTLMNPDDDGFVIVTKKKRRGNLL